MEHYIPIGATKIWTDITGCGQDKYIVLCSGGAGCCDYLFPVAQMIDDGYRVIRFEQRGCGRSDKDGNYTVQTAISDLEAIRAYYGINSWAVGGHSWGAVLSLLYAALHPDKVDAIVFVAGIGIQNNREWIEEFLAKRSKFGEVMPEMLYPFSEEVNNSINQSFRKYIQQPSLYKDIANLKMPALFVGAENDLRADWPVRQLQALVEHSVYVTIPGAAHYIWLTHPNELRAELRRFLALPG